MINYIGATVAIIMLISVSIWALRSLAFIAHGDETEMEGTVLETSLGRWIVSVALAFAAAPGILSALAAIAVILTMF